MRVRLAVLLTYLTIGLAVVSVWTYCARTEYEADKLDSVTLSGERFCSRFNSIVRIADGSAISPFVKRRLLADLAMELGAIIPQGAWERMEQAVQAEGVVPAAFRAGFRRLGWKPAHYPLLVSAFLLMWLSAVGFMYSCRWMVNQLYTTPAWIANLAGAAMGLALLGGNGDWHYCGYPYDIPQAFIFTFTLAAMMARKKWFILPFVLAVYSKETSVLLVLAYMLLRENRRSISFWSVAALLGALFMAIRYWIDLRYPVGSSAFWFPMRNLKQTAIMGFYSWYWPFLGVAAARFLSMRSQFPPELKRLSLLALPLLAIAFFKGWIEEMRQYLEVLPIMGLMVVQWVLFEAKCGRLLQPRWQAASQSGPNEALDRQVNDSPLPARWFPRAA